MTVPQSFTKRIIREIDNLMIDPEIQSYFRYERTEQDEQSKQTKIYGFILPHIEPYSHASIRIEITLPPEYPFKEPDLRILTYIFHPAISDNIANPTNCRGCLGCTWNVLDNMSLLIKRFVDLINEPDMVIRNKCILNFEASELYVKNRIEFEKVAIMMVKMYASPNLPPSIITLKFGTKQMIRKLVDSDTEKINELLLPESLKSYVRFN